MKKFIFSALILIGVISVTKAGEWNMYDTQVPLDSLISEGGRSLSKVDVAYENGNISCLTYYNKTNNAWVPYSKQLYTYDAQGREVEELLQSFSNGAWQNTSKTVRSFDGPKAQEPSITTMYYYHKGDQKWINQDKTEVTFNSDGLPTDYRVYTWLDEAWSAIQWGQVKYNEQNQRSEYTMQTWIRSKEAWQNSMRYIYYYDDRGNTIKTTTDEWDLTVEPNDWTLIHTEESLYNDDNKPTSRMYTAENKSIMTYRYKIEFFYNAIGDPYQLITSDWNISAESWVLNATTTFYYRQQQAIESVSETPSSRTRKLFRGGQVLIQKGDKTFTLTGQEVK